MKAYQTASERGGYKLAQLCQAADFHPSTIHYYLKIGLLHRPRRVGLGLYLYDDSHLHRLNEIRALREAENLSLSKIKERIGRGEEDSPGWEDGFEPFGAGRNRGFLARARGLHQGERTKERLLDTAAELFSRKGYEGTTINDITRSLQMSKGSFYLFFQDKKELFIECIRRLADLIAPGEAREETTQEGDHTARLFRKAVAFLEAFPSYAGLLSPVRIAAMGDDPSLSHTSKEAFGRIVEPILRDFRRAVEEGMVRNVDEEVFAGILLGMAEALGFKRMTDPEFDLDGAVERYVELIARGILTASDPPTEKGTARNPAGEITDVGGDSVKVREVLFGGKPHLSGCIGEGDVQVHTDRVAFILLDHTAPECIAELTMEDGEKSRLELDGNMIVSAASSVGLYTIPLRRIHSISFA